MNLVKDKWIATTKGLKSMEEVFQEASTLDLSGRPDHVVSNMGLLLAVVQDACTWKDEEEWLKRKDSYTADVLAYLGKHVDKFSLEGGFLQDPSLEGKEWYSVDYLDISKMKGTQVQTFASMKSEWETDPAKLAQDLVSYQGYSPSETKGWRLGQVGPRQGALGYLHSFLCGKSLKESLHMSSLLDGEADASYPGGKGVAPWVSSCGVNQTYIGTLAPLSRRLLIEGDVFIQENGLPYEGLVPPSVTIKGRAQEKNLFLWTDPSRKPWRELTAMLSFIGGGEGCLLLSKALRRASGAYPAVGVRCVGVQCAIKTGAQQFTGSSAGVDSVVFLPGEAWGSLWYESFKGSIATLDNACSMLGKAVFSYWSYLKCDKKASGGYATKARNSWWAAMEKEAARVVAGEVIPKDQLLQTALGIFQEHCPTVTHRGLMAYTKAIQKLQSEEK